MQKSLTEATYQGKACTHENNNVVLPAVVGGAALVVVPSTCNNKYNYEQN